MRDIYGGVVSEAETLERYRRLVIQESDISDLEATNALLNYLLVHGKEFLHDFVDYIEESDSGAKDLKIFLLHRKLDSLIEEYAEYVGCHDKEK